MAPFKPGEPRTRKREEAELLFPTIKEVLDLHKQAIEEFGGAHGLRDEAALDSAIMAAENRANDEIVDLFLGIAASQITRDEIERIFAQRVKVAD